ncbi:MAG: carbohydrate kinase family protein [Acidimicrobiia bacterium]
MSYAITIGEALVDMIESRHGAETVYRPVPGGSPLNIAVGLARLGVPVEFVGSFGDDPLGDRLRAFLTENGVGLRGSFVTGIATSLAMTTFEGPDPRFTFYGSPHSFGVLGPEHLVQPLLAEAALIHCGSISLLEENVYRAALSAFGATGPLKTLDPNVRPSLIEDLDRYRSSMERLFHMVDVVKLSAEDASLLYPGSSEQIARRIGELGVRVVIITLGAQGAMALLNDRVLRVSGREVEAVDTTGAGDAFMAAVIAELVRAPFSMTTDDWQAILGFAVDVSALACCEAGGATAMPTREAVAARFGAR